MILYHYTCQHHWKLIHRDGIIKPGDAVLRRGGIVISGGQNGCGLGPQLDGDPMVVWATTNETPRQRWQYPDALSLIDRVQFDKSVIRITINVLDAARWPEWSIAHGIDKKWYRDLARSGGRRGDAKLWYVIERAIPQSEWITVHNTKTWEVLYAQ